MRTVVFAHGKESGPQGVKIRALGEVAQDCGWQILSPDFRGMDDPNARVRRLLDVTPRRSGRLVLAGSSMGGYVVTAASTQLEPAGLFLMAPALGLPAYPESDLPPRAGRVVAVHGWGDAIVPAANVIAWAGRHRVPLTLVDDEHNLQGSLPLLADIFRRLLQECAGPRGAVISLF